jgi:superfamily II DNA or RNA helicase
MSTPYHSQYYAYELTKRLASDNADKLSQSLLNATVDLNPHQIEAALFAFRSPLSRGAILADEVGLGKTIEAGLIVSQLWAEHKRRILCIAPASLRKQWNRELLEKFFIESIILESKNFNRMEKDGDANPFEHPGQVVICSYQFAKAKAEQLQQVHWDLVVIDEAHRLRNVYKKSNKIARAIRDAIGTCPLVLLTATPLQNSLMELYGLVSFIDPHLFGSEESFRSQFATRPGAATDGHLASLKERIAPICQRTLRRQVTEYVPYTNRISFTQDFTPTDSEARLYDSVSHYLQKEQLHALPNSQRQLITLILRKILASSSFAISSTLGKLISRLEALKQDASSMTPEDVADLLGDELEHTDELQDEWSENADDDTEDANGSLEAAVAAIGAEIDELRSYKSLAESITTNAKGEALLAALKAGLQKMEELGSPQKALIFTESRRTQVYLKELLSNNGYAGSIVTFNGTNSDPESKAIYKEWLKQHEGEDCVTGSATADSRAALVEHFRDAATIMIATESAAEGVNLQFCNLVVNYDLPWNPQRIEQRIGRCHRYGQKFDVVVINFLNRRNEADRRVFELLAQKFRLFDGVFGASDEVLGTLETGVDFERRIFEIYQGCRTNEEITAAFDTLQEELEEQINARMEDARAKLMEHFDEEVHDKLRTRHSDTAEQVTRYERWLWSLTKTELNGDADFDDNAFSFRLQKRPSWLEQQVPLGEYRLIRHRTDDVVHHYRFDHPLMQQLLVRAKQRELPPREIIFDHSNYPRRVSLAEKHEGHSGWLRVSRIRITALEQEDHLVFSGRTDEGMQLSSDECQALLAVPGVTGAEVDMSPGVIEDFDEILAASQARLLSDNEDRNLRFFADEEEKLDRWAEDLKESLERELKEIAAEIRTLKKESRAARNLEDKVELQKRVREMEKKQSAKRKHLFQAQDEVDEKRDHLIEETQKKLEQSVQSKHLFTIRWTVT